MKKDRRLKVYEKAQLRRFKYVVVPEIRLEGKWLQKLGFEAGKEIYVQQQKNKLTIRLLDKEE